MKALKNFSTLALMLTMFSFSSIASDMADPNGKTVKNAKEAVMQADANDYMTLAKSAEVCLKLNENTEEALRWLQTSIEINPTPYNLELKADYLASIGQNKLATNYYLRAVLAEDSLDHNSRLQDKILSMN